MKTSAFDIAGYSNYRDCVNQYSDSYIKNACAVKVSEDDSNVCVAVALSHSEDSISYLTGFHLPKKTEFIIVKDEDFLEFVGNFVDLAVKTSRQPVLSDGFKIDNISQSSQVINIINSIFIEAIKRNASDIHIQPECDEIRVRFRIDGVLNTVKTLDFSLADSITSRIKVMANLNIMETRLPQDGRLQVSVSNKKLSFRVSIVPVFYGESIVLRLFNSNSVICDLDSLGMSNDNLKSIKTISHISNGLILVTGPTGSGKSTTLHSILNSMNKDELKIVTVEDPVEQSIYGIDQIQVNESAGLSFENILRRLLRQDPDVIMVGEVRDTQTAQLAVRAALTGHLILTTLHTNDSISAVTRLKNMGIESFLISSVLRYSMAQRLVRRLCPLCSKKINVTDETKNICQKYGLSIDFEKKAVGCPDCNFTGYKGRLAVTEVFEIDDEIKQIIESESCDTSLNRYLLSKGFTNLTVDALKKVIAFETSFEELKREGVL